MTITTTPEVATMVSMYEEGTSLQAIADHFDSTLHIVRRRLLRAGVHMRSRGRPRKTPGQRPRYVVDVEKEEEKRRLWLDRADAMLNLYVNEHRTLEEIGEQFDVTRERVRQILVIHDRTLYQLAKGRKQARSRLRKIGRNIAESNPRVSTAPCWTCGEVVGVGRDRFCSDEHCTIAMRLRLHWNEEQHDRHLVCAAKWAIRHPDQVSPHLLAYAERKVSGEAGKPDGHRDRWLVVGSQNWDTAVEVYHNGWPLFARFNPQVQEQIIRKVGPPYE